MQDVTRARGQEGANATIFSAAGLVVPFQDTVSLTPLHSVNRDLVQGRAENPSPHSRWLLCDP